MELEELYVNTSKVELYLDGQKVEFNTPPDILFNYSVTDLNSPAAVKNTYTKQLNIPGTKKNNDIFNHIYNLERIQGYTAMYSGGEFNPIRTTEFTLYVNGEIYESGYFKLNEVNVNNNNIVYSITLFGGLGSFFWCLSHNVGSDGDTENPEPKKMSDLIFPCEKKEEGVNESLDFTINKETVNEAWRDYLHNSWQKWGTINFAPCLEGVPGNFESDKVLFYKNEYGNWVWTFGPNGYDLVNLPKELNMLEAHDLRSYLQRPILRVRSVIEACCNPENNGGYTVELDDHFFNGDNPYYDQVWCTLKTLPELELKSESEEALDLSKITVGERNNSNKTFPILTEYDNSTKYSNLKLSMNMVFGSEKAVQCTSPALYTSRDFRNKTYSILKTDTKWFKYRSSICIELVGYDAMGVEVAKSNMIELHTRMDDDYTFTNNVIYGSFKKMADGRYIFVDEEGNTVNMNFYLNSDIVCYSFGVRVTRPFAAKGKWRFKGGAKFDWDKWRNCTKDDGAPYLYTNTSLEISTTIPYDEAARRDAVDFTYGWITPSFENDCGQSRYSAMYFIPALTSIDGVIKQNVSFLSNLYVSKEKLLTMDCTPADFFISYCKIFGMYIWKEPDAKVIHVMDRNTFYTQEVVNLEKYIDRAKQLRITPRLAESKWYDFKLEAVESEAGEEYEANYNQTYGNKRVNTNCNYNSEINDIFEGNVFKSGVEVLGKSPYFKKEAYNHTPQPSGTPSQPDISPVFENGATYSSFDASFNEEVHNNPFGYGLNGVDMNSVFPGYDIAGKLQFCNGSESTDGSMVLGFIGGLGMDIGDCGYYLTDDTNEMAVLGDNPCWLATNGRYGIKVYSYPKFSRFKMLPGVGARNITHSLEFGNAMVTYLPETFNTNDMAIYDRFWKAYTEDLYSVDNRLLSCYVLIQQKPHPEWLRRFYWFDNALWRLNKIADWNVSSMDTTRCEFVKVLDKSSYTLLKPLDGARVELYLEDVEPTEVVWSDEGRRKTIYYDLNHRTQSVNMILKRQDGANVESHTDYDNWITPHPEWYYDGSNAPGTYKLSLTANATGNVRQCEFLAIADEIQSAKVVIRQQPDSTMTVSPLIDSISGAGVGSIRRDATSGRYYYEASGYEGELHALSVKKWLSFTIEGNKIWLNVERNDTGAERTAKIVIRGTVGRVDVELIQMG